MSYIQDNLLPDEKILFSARVHPAVFLPSIICFLAIIPTFIYSLKFLVKVGTPGSPAPAPDGNIIIGMFLLPISCSFFVCFILLGLRALIVKRTTEFAVTNRRVIAKTGFIRRHTVEMLLAKVESVAVQQGILGRLLNFGTVTVTGTGGTQESFKTIAEPLEVRKKINQIIERYMQAYAEFQQKKA